MIVYFLGTITKGICLQGCKETEVDVFSNAREEKLEKKTTTGILAFLRNHRYHGLPENRM